MVRIAALTTGVQMLRSSPVHSWRPSAATRHEAFNSIILLILATGLATSQATITVDPSTLTGSYNPASAIARDDDQSASTFAAFTTDVSAAFASGNGAVWGFNQTASQPGQTDTEWFLDFATGKRLTITTDRNFGYLNFSSTGFTSSSTGSGDMGAVANGVPDRSTVTMDFALSGANLALDEQIREIGIVFLSRNGDARTVAVTATLDDASTIALSEALAAGVDSDNTHFGVKAPGARYITGLTLDAPGSFVTVDDLGFITSSPIPEPGALSLLLLGVPLLLFHRRRR